MAKYRFNFLSNFGDSYKTLDRCYLVDTVGGTTPLNPSGTTFSGSTNIISAGATFEAGYLRAGVDIWHGNSNSGANSFWGIVDFGSNDPVIKELVIKSQSTAVNRAPKSFSLERYDTGLAEWVTIIYKTSESAWSASEERRYRLYYVSGTIYDDTGTGAARQVHLLDRATGVLRDRMTSASDGTFRLYSTTNDECQRIALDNASGTTYNDLIDRVTPG